MTRIVEILKNIYHLLPEPPSTNYLYREISPNPYKLLPPQPVIFDIGSKESRGFYAFGSPPSDAKVVCVDIESGPGVDLVADAHDLHMVADESVDFVISISVLEHVRQPQKVMQEIFRILKPDGMVYINVHFVFPFHADLDVFYRFSYKSITIIYDCFAYIKH